jgi:predicted GNAT family acetyltransferase
MTKLEIMHALDNVIWQALTTRQAHFAEGSGHARRFMRDVTSLSAFQEPNADGYGSLARLVGEGGTAGLFLDDAYQARDGWNYIGGAPLLQMVCENGQRALNSRIAAHICELGSKDSRGMVGLTALTKPGPFGSRTHELGTYLGIRENGKLVAMAGERMKVPGHTEVSAVCTHPDHLGKGYAALLLTEIMRLMRQRGEIPFLHVREDNTRAIALYQRLGFRTRIRRHYAILRRIETS